MERYKIIVILIILLLLCLFFTFILDPKVKFYDFENHSMIKKNNCILTIDINCDLHFGDNIFNMYYLNSLKQYLETNGIKINYYLNKNYIKEISNFCASENVKLLPYQNKGLYLGLTNLTFDNNGVKKFLTDVCIDRNRMVFDKLYINFFNESSKKLGFNYEIKSLLNTDPRIYDRYYFLPDEFKDVDILFINSEPQSYQYINTGDDWDKYITDLQSMEYKIVTTKKVPNVICTLDYGLSLFDIGAISTRAKVIIGIGTGPFASIINIYTLKNAKQIYLFDNRVCYSYKKIKNISKLSEVDLNLIKRLL
jgi:hypothetical protein